MTVAKACRRLLMMTVIMIVLSIGGNDWNSLNWSALHNATLPRKDSNIAAAYYNGSILLFGGRKYVSQYVEFNIISQTFIDGGEKHLSFNLSGNSKHYTQIKNIFYAIDPAEAHVFIYNLATKQLSFSSKMHSNVGEYGCLTSLNNLLFITGGSSKTQAIQNTQIYNTSSGIWTKGSSMHNARIYHACVVDPIDEELYVIGGISTVYNHSLTLNSVEKIDIDSIYSETSIWRYTESLSEGIMSATAIMIESTHEIYLCCGVSWVNGVPEVFYPQVIDCEDGSVSALSYTDFNADVYAVATINVHNTIYLFGGFHFLYSMHGKTVYDYDLYAVDTWKYLHLFPTKAPTFASIVSTESATDSSQKQYKGKVFVTVVILFSFICCVVIIGCYVSKTQISNGEKVVSQYNEELIDLGYIELPEGCTAEGHNKETKHVEEQEDEDIYNYAPPSDSDNNGEGPSLCVNTTTLISVIDELHSSAENDHEPQ